MKSREKLLEDGWEGREQGSLARNTLRIPPQISALRRNSKTWSACQPAPWCPARRNWWAPILLEPCAPSAKPERACSVTRAALKGAGLPGAENHHWAVAGRVSSWKRWNLSLPLGDLPEGLKRGDQTFQEAWVGLAWVRRHSEVCWLNTVEIAEARNPEWPIWASTRCPVG